MDRDVLIALGDLNLVEALREQTRACGGTIIEEDGVLLMLGPLPHPILNNAVRLDPDVEAGECMELVSDFYAAHEHGFTLVLRNASEDADLEAAAENKELISLLTPPEMVVEHRLDEKPPPDDVEIRRVVDGGGLSDFRTVAQEAWTTYGIPPEVTARIFTTEHMVLLPHVAGVVAYLDGVPAACALVHLSHGIAGVYWVSTVSSARGRGLGEACTRAVTNIGFDLGARALSLQASPMGDAIYRRMGYVEVARYKLVAALAPGD